MRKCLRAQITCANHLSIIACFLSYEKWVQREKYPFKAHLPYIISWLIPPPSDLSEALRLCVWTSTINIEDSEEQQTYIWQAWRASATSGGCWARSETHACWTPQPAASPVAASPLQNESHSPLPQNFHSRVQESNRGFSATDPLWRWTLTFGPDPTSKAMGPSWSAFCAITQTRTRSLPLTPSNSPNPSNQIFHSTKNETFIKSLGGQAHDLSNPNTSCNTPYLGLPTCALRKNRNLSPPSF